MTNEDSEKIKILYEIYEQPMYRIAYAVLNNTECAEDAVSEAFVRIIRKIRKIDDPYSEKTKHYIVKVIKSTSIDQYRINKKHSENTQSIQEETYLIPDSSVDIESKVSDKSDYELLELLNDTDKNIVMLRCCDGLPWSEVAQKVSLTEANTRKRFERAKKRIKSTKGGTYYEKIS